MLGHSQPGGLFVRNSSVTASGVFMPIPSVSEIIGLIKTGATIEAQEKVMELRQDALVHQEENIQLRAQVKELQDALELSKKMRWDGSYYWQDGDDTPFCSHCFDNTRKAIHLFTGRHMGHRWTCPNCKTRFGRSHAGDGAPVSRQAITDDDPG